MSVLLVEDREQYHSDNGVSALGVITMLPVFGAASLLGGFLLAVMFHEGIYLLILAPLIAVGLICGASHLWTRFGKCRNQWLSVSLCALSGLFAYLAYYYFSLCFSFGFQVVPNPMLLPRYIQWRLETDVSQDVKNPNRVPPKPSFGMNCFTFVYELGMVISMPIAVGWKRSRRAFSVESEQWFETETIGFLPYSGPKLKEALETGTLTDFIEFVPPAPTIKPSCHLTVEYLRTPNGQLADEPVYLTILDHRQDKPFYWPAAMRMTLVRQVEIGRTEVAAIAKVFPNLMKVVDPQWLADEYDDDLEVIGDNSAAGLRVQRAVAEVTPVPEPYRQKVRTSAYPLVVNLYGLLPLGIMFAGGGAVAGGGYLISLGFTLPGVCLFLCGIPILLWGVFTGLFSMSVYEHRWINKRLRDELSLRPDPLVDARDPDAILISIVPRESFLKVKLVMSSDLCLLAFDDARGRLLFEGDIDRYIIPFEAIELCEPLCFFSPVDTQQQNELWVVRLMVRFSDSKKELLFSVPHIKFQRTSNRVRFQHVDEVSQRINAVARHE